MWSFTTRIMPLSEFAKDRCAGMTRISWCASHKDGRKAAYTTWNSSTVPLLACYCIRRAAIGMWLWGPEPSKAQVVTITDDGYDSLAQLAREAADSFTYGIIPGETAGTAVSWHPRYPPPDGTSHRRSVTIG